ncbi:FecR domain-containing protein [Pseudomonas sp. LRF_L74]|uniref:FecR domain-containing protein n=1 Tax=Pseudomonas sp. LRF_L74 TaxID=3369422 RepID=UPI003F614113
MSERQRLIDETTQWLVLVNSGLASDAELQAFHDWRLRDPDHERLCKCLERTLGVLLQVPQSQGVNSDLLRRALAAPSSRRRLLGQALALGSLAFGGTLLGSRALPMDSLLADLRTGTGERRSVTLADSSRLTLNACSSVDMGDRKLRLHDGEILLEVAPRSGAQPFVLATADGEAHLPAGRVLLRHGDYSQVVSFGTALSMRSAQGVWLELAAGSQVHFDRHGFGPVTPSQGNEGAWVNGILEVRDQPLAEVIEALRLYRQGVVRVDPQVASLRVSGLFRLDDSELMLEALVRTLPIRISRLTDYWIILEAA